MSNFEGRNTEDEKQPKGNAFWLMILGVFLIVMAAIIGGSGGEGSGIFFGLGVVALIAAAITRPVELHLRRLRSIEGKL